MEEVEHAENRRLALHIAADRELSKNGFNIHAFGNEHLDIAEQLCLVDLTDARYYPQLEPVEQDFTHEANFFFQDNESTRRFSETIQDDFDALQDILDEIDEEIDERPHQDDINLPATRSARIKSKIDDSRRERTAKPRDPGPKQSSGQQDDPNPVRDFVGRAWDFFAGIPSWTKDNINEHTYARLKGNLKDDDMPFDVFRNWTRSDSTELIHPDRHVEERERWGLGLPFLALGLDMLIAVFVTPAYAAVGFTLTPRREAMYWLIFFSSFFGIL